MRRKIIVQAEPRDVLAWLNHWFMQKVHEEGIQSYLPTSLLEELSDDPHFVDTFLKEIKKQISGSTLIPEGAVNKEFAREVFRENTSLIGELSDLLMNEKRLELLVQARYSIVVGQQSRKPILANVNVLSFKLYRIGEPRTQVQVECDVPEAVSILDDLWQDIHSTFEVLEKQKDPAPAIKADQRNSNQRNIESPQQKGRYRLTEEEIKFRRQKVKEAQKIKKQNPQKQWKEIDRAFADELGISERTFRSWRHNNY